MRLSTLTRLGLIASLVIVAGCSGNTDKIEGIWSSEAALLNGEETPAGARILQFGKDSHLMYSVAGRTYKGTYSLGMGLSITFTLDDEFEGRKIHPHKIIIDGDRLTLISADGSELNYQKVNLKSKAATP